LDVGGGHAQIAPLLIEAGYAVTVVGSNPVCRERLTRWTETQSFDAVVCFRLLPHSVAWTRLVGELCRVARQSVLLDYPSSRSANILSERLFALKKGIELNTRPFMLFTPREIRRVFAAGGFAVAAERQQFLVPMALHRLGNRTGLSRAAEAPGRLLGLTRWFGSPIIVRADRLPT